MFLFDDVIMYPIPYMRIFPHHPWWRHQMETFFALLAPLCGEFTGTGEFPSKLPVTRSLDVFFDLRLNKRLGKLSRGWWYETLSCTLWRYCNGRTTKNLSRILTTKSHAILIPERLIICFLLLTLLYFIKRCSIVIDSGVSILVVNI